VADSPRGSLETESLQTKSPVSGKREFPACSGEPERSSRRRLSPSRSPHRNLPYAAAAPAGEVDPEILLLRHQLHERPGLVVRKSGSPPIAGICRLFRKSPRMSDCVVGLGGLELRNKGACKRRTVATGCRYRSPMAKLMPNSMPRPSYTRVTRRHDRQHREPARPADAVAQEAESPCSRRNR
jgi:hypothetical protein